MWPPALKVIRILNENLARAHFIAHRPVQSGLLVFAATGETHSGETHSKTSKSDKAI